MSHLSYKTISANAETADKQWVVIDAKGQNLGRFSSVVAYVLRGKHKPNFTPHADCGDNVIIINCEQIEMSGSKMQEKEYIWHTGYPGGQRVRNAEEMMKRQPHKVLEKSIKGMLPKNKLGNQLFRNLYVYVGGEHPHSAQQPTVLDINTVK